MKTILVPTDFSAAALNALEYALPLAESLKADLHLVHAYFFENMTASNLPPEVKDQMLTLERKDAQRKLVNLAAKIKAKAPESVSISHHLDVGFPAQSIYDMAKDLKADLIIMGTQGASNLPTRLLGTVASSVIKEAPCPVLVIPSEARYESIRKIVYAGNFEDGETNVFEKLENFAWVLNTQLACVHVRTHKEDPEMYEQYDRYFKEKAMMHKAEYYPINHGNVVEGLDTFLEIMQTDILAILHHKRSLLAGIFTPSITKKMVLHTKTPLLIFTSETVNRLVSQQQA